MLGAGSTDEAIGFSTNVGVDIADFDAFKAPFTSVFSKFKAEIATRAAELSGRAGVQNLQPSFTDCFL